MMNKILDFLSDSKKRKAVVFAIISVVILILIISVLKPEYSDETQTSNNGTQTQAIISGSDKTPEEIHFYKEYSENFVADADIPASTPESAAVLYAQYAIFDEQTLLDLFYKDKSPTYEVNSSEKLVLRDGELNASNGSYLNYVRGSIRYNLNSNSIIKLPTESLFTKFDYVKFSGSMNPSYASVYKKNSLEFMSREAAVAEAMSILDELSITVSDDVEIYAIDCETMQTYQDNELEAYPSLRDVYDIKDVFTREDEFYILNFTVIHNSIPLSHRHYTQASSGRSAPGTNVKIHISSKGITLLEAENIFEIQAEAETVSNFISAEKAIDVAFNKYNSFIYDTQMLVTDVDFVYISVPYNENENEVMLVPAWDIMMKYNGGFYEGYDAYQMMTVNAVTGEEIK